MLLKKTIGLFIILANIAGLGFLLYIAAMMLKDKFFSNDGINTVQEDLAPKKGPSIDNDDIISDEDDLLKDMDLSDLDNLNLDDFE